LSLTTHRRASDRAGVRRARLWPAVCSHWGPSRPHPREG